MSLIYSCISPHTPVLLPSIGKDHLEKADELIKQLERINQRLYFYQPDTIIVISPHSQSSDTDAFCIHSTPNYKSSFEEFGDITTKLEFSCDVVLADKIKQNFYTSVFPVLYTSQDDLDYGAAVPLYYLTKNLKSKILAINPSQLSYKTHFDFGKYLYDIIQIQNKRIAVVCSADLSHRLAENSPAGFSPEGAKFDKKIIAILTGNDYKKINRVSKDITNEAAACGVSSLALFLGIMNQANFKGDLLAYQNPFGIGNIVMDFK